MEIIKSVNVESDDIDVIDTLTVLKNSIVLFEMKYGKYMDANALNSLQLISKSAQKLEKKLMS